MLLTVHFCGECGTRIYKEGDREDFFGTVIVQAGTLDGDEGGKKGMGIGDFKVGVELWVKERVGWLEEVGGAGQCQEFA
jgi:hypothetical protein